MDIWITDPFKKQTKKKIAACMIICIRQLLNHNWHATKLFNPIDQNFGIFLPSLNWQFSFFVFVPTALKGEKHNCFNICGKPKCPSERVPQFLNKYEHLMIQSKAQLFKEEHMLFSVHILCRFRVCCCGPSGNLF